MEEKKVGTLAWLAKWATILSFMLALIVYIQQRSPAPTGPAISDSPIAGVQPGDTQPYSVRPQPVQPTGYFSVTDRLAPRQVRETIDLYIDGVRQGTLALDGPAGRTSMTLPVMATNHRVQYMLKGVETDTLEGAGIERQRTVVGGGTIADPSPGRRFEFQPVRPFFIAPGEIPPTQIEEKIIPSR